MMLVPGKKYDRVENIRHMAKNLYDCSAKEQNLGDITAWSSRALNDIASELAELREEVRRLRVELKESCDVPTQTS